MDKMKEKLICDKDDKSPECVGAWSDFWKDNNSYFDDDLTIGLDRVKKWVLPVEVDNITGECFISIPDDLRLSLNWNEGKRLEWVDNYNGSFTLKAIE